LLISRISNWIAAVLGDEKEMDKSIRSLEQWRYLFIDGHPPSHAVFDEIKTRGAITNFVFVCRLTWQ
jgi:hypothetical protein